MKLEVTQMLSDMAFLKENIKSIRFMRNDGSWFTTFPSIDQWAKGDIVLEINSVGGYAAVVKELQNCLSHYGIECQVVSINSAIENAVQFSANSGDDIIVILAKSLADQKLQAQAGEMRRQLAGLNQNVDQLVEQLPHVRHGAFSRGVNAMKNQVEVLKNIRQNQR